MQLTAENKAYAAAFEAIELIAASARINISGLHHRYHAATAVSLLRNAAAARLRVARSVDRATARKVYRRHRSQI